MAGFKNARLLRAAISGELLTDNLSRYLYATDASSYFELPLGVVFPRDENDVAAIVQFAAVNSIPLVPRGAGTSLAGQVVGRGVVVDFTRHMNRLIQVNHTQKWAEVQPGLVLDDLNREVAASGLYFGPETSTSNRCTIGGMIGNNSCGARSLIYGSTRDHLLSVSGFIASGEKVQFTSLSEQELATKLNRDDREGEIYRLFREIYSNDAARVAIKDEFPHPGIKRRNTGYALDSLLSMAPFCPGGARFNLSPLIAGSEGTLMVVTSARVALVPLPSRFKVLLCAHFTTLFEALDANIKVVNNNRPEAVELVDKKILEMAKYNKNQSDNRFFIKGDPGALLLIEFSGHTIDDARGKAAAAIHALAREGLGYAFPTVEGKDISRVWSLRKAGLGLLSNMEGDSRPVSLIEDCAVRVEDLKQFVTELDKMLTGHGKSCVYHAHAGSGELHVRPVLDLKDASELRLARVIATETARLVKKFRGSLSGEHGDGRARGEFIPYMLGEGNYELMKRIKKAFDPGNILNPGKKVFAPPLDQSLRYQKPDESLFRRFFTGYGKPSAILGASEKCSGSADCIKGKREAGTMCPSYMATRNEKDSTRGRANALRAYLAGHKGEVSLSAKDIKEVLDLCLSCKACKSECPSGVDMAKLKAGMLQQFHHRSFPSPFNLVMANLSSVDSLLQPLHFIINPVIKTPGFKFFASAVAGVSRLRTLPPYSSEKLGNWVTRESGRMKNQGSTGKVMLFADEVTNFRDSAIGIKTVLLLRELGYQVILAPIKDSGRSKISVGYINAAAGLARENIIKIAGKISSSMPFVGIEPSAILTFRDEYPGLVPASLRQTALEIASCTYTIEEFLDREMKAGRVGKNSFTSEEGVVKFHAHCHFKALSDSRIIKGILSFPRNYVAEEIESGCCGMAGSFGYRRRNYNLSVSAGELKLLPSIRQIDDGIKLVATGFSCRSQIYDLTGRHALHPVEVLFNALVKMNRPR